MSQSARDAIEFASRVIEDQRTAWETGIREVSDGELSCTPTGTPLDHALRHPELFLARSPRNSL